MYSEFRKDPVSNEWILIVPGRLKYYKKKFKKSYLKRAPARVRTPRLKCPFERPFKNISEKIILGYSRSYKGDPKVFPKKNDSWEVLVLQNRYPVVRHDGARISKKRVGIYESISGVGHADIVLTRGHDDSFPRLDEWATHAVFRAFRDRYEMLKKERDIKYALSFHNWGLGAGASIYHPHYQIFGIPIIPPDVMRSLGGSRDYFITNKRCVHCDMIKTEIKMRRRVILEDENSIAVAPFVSRNPFEIRIFPKSHIPNFEITPDEILFSVSSTLKKVLDLLGKKLGDPDYNFFIHSAPLSRGKEYSHYHWHIEVYPKISTRAGFEFGTGIEVNSFDSAFVSKILRD